MDNNHVSFDQANDIPCNIVEISEVEQICGNVVKSIKETLKQLPPINEECSIYRVPKLLRKMNEMAYIPQVISFGPFHHCSQEDLIATERYKLQGCLNFLRRINDTTSSWEFLVRTAQPWVQEHRNCYAEPIKMSNEDFVKMMLIDGCFIVEFLILYYHHYFPDKFPNNPNNVNLSFYKRIPDIDIDLIKLENQIPFSFLQRLFNLIPQENDTENDTENDIENDTKIQFIELTYVFLQRGLVYNYELLLTSLPTPKHFVDFLSFYFIVSKMSHVGNTDAHSFISPPSITELCEAGVTIKKAKDAKCVMNISFKNGVLEISPLLLDDNFETMMRNLIVFEHFSLVNESKCIQYVTFMDYLISTEKDVNLLVETGIIINEIGGSDKEVAELFNNLCKFATVPNSYHFNSINKALHDYCSRRWNKAKASLKHNYFNTPWAIVSFFAATFLIILTLLQAIFSGISAF